MQNSKPNFFHKKNVRQLRASSLIRETFICMKILDLIAETLILCGNYTPLRLIPMLNRIKPGSRTRGRVQCILEALEHMTGVLLPVSAEFQQFQDSDPRALQEQLLQAAHAWHREPNGFPWVSICKQTCDELYQLYCDIS